MGFESPMGDFVIFDDIGLVCRHGINGFVGFNEFLAFLDDFLHASDYGGPSKFLTPNQIRNQYVERYLNLLFR